MLVLQRRCTIKIYIDGACQPNPGHGGWAVLVLDENNNEIERLTGNVKHTTNNRMEITAAAKALTLIPDGTEATIYSDSTLVVNTLSLGWKKNLNHDLWDIVDNNLLGKNVSWVWVKSHNGHRWNEVVNKMAQEAIKRH